MGGRYYRSGGPSNSGECERSRLNNGVRRRAASGRTSGQGWNDFHARESVSSCEKRLQTARETSARRRRASRTGFSRQGKRPQEERTARHEIVSGQAVHPTHRRGRWGTSLLIRAALLTVGRVPGNGHHEASGRWTVRAVGLPTVPVEWPVLRVLVPPTAATRGRVVPRTLPWLGSPTARGGCRLPARHSRPAAGRDDEVSAGEAGAATARWSVDVGWRDVVGEGEAPIPYPYPQPLPLQPPQSGTPRRLLKSCLRSPCSLLLFNYSLLNGRIFTDRRAKLQIGRAFLQIGGAKLQIGRAFLQIDPEA